MDVGIFQEKIQTMSLQNCPFCGYIAMANVDLINFQEREKKDEATHPPFTETPYRVEFSITQSGETCQNKQC